MQADYGKSNFMISLVICFEIIDNNLDMTYIVLIIVCKSFGDFVDSPPPCIVVIKAMVLTLAIILLAVFGPFRHSVNFLAAPLRVLSAKTLHTGSVPCVCWFSPFVYLSTVPRVDCRDKIKAHRW